MSFWFSITIVSDLIIALSAKKSMVFNNHQKLFLHSLIIPVTSCPTIPERKGKDQYHYNQYY